MSAKWFQRALIIGIPVERANNRVNADCRKRRRSFLALPLAAARYAKR